MVNRSLTAGARDAGSIMPDGPSHAWARSTRRARSAPSDRRSGNACGSPHRCKLYCKRTGPVVLIEIDPLVDRVHLVLSCAEGHGRNTVADHPVRIQPTIRGTDARASTDAGYRRDRALDDGKALLHAERMVVGLRLELDAARFAIAVLDALCGLLECHFIGFGDLPDELAVVAAAFAAHVHIVGDDIGGVSGRPPLAAGDRANIARALPLAFHHLSEPAAGLHVGKRERKDHGRRDPALRRDAGMRGATENLDLPAIRADGADGDVGGGTAVVVEGHDRRAEVGGPDMARAP